MENTLKAGDKVAYKRFNGSYENGIVKSLAGQDAVFVVYYCSGEWESYQNYTAVRTNTDRLVKGWRN